jgi:hypothetical protein
MRQNYTRRLTMFERDSFYILPVTKQKALRNPDTKKYSITHAFEKYMTAVLTRLTGPEPSYPMKQFV